jgi:hypothetical protein
VGGITAETVSARGQNSHQLQGNCRDAERPIVRGTCFFLKSRMKND